MDARATDSIAQACFLFEPDPDGGKSIKQRYDGFIPCYEEEQNEFVRARWNAYKSYWAQLRSEVETVVSELHRQAVEDVCAFVGRARVHREDTLPTALVFSGVNVADHHRIFAALALQCNVVHGCHVVRLQARHCTSMAAMMKALVTRCVDVPPGGCYTMEVLESWYDDTYRKEAGAEEEEEEEDAPPVLLMLEDVEQFRGDVLAGLLAMVHAHARALPVVLVLGVATSAEFLHMHLPRKVLVTLATQRFYLTNSVEAVDCVVDRVFISGHGCIRLGDRTLAFLIDNFLLHHFTVSKFVHGLQYVMMEHFYNEPLAFLCAHDARVWRRSCARLDASHMTHVRALPSVRAFLNSAAAPLAARLTRDDEALRAHVRDVWIPEHLRLLWTWGTAFKVLYYVCVRMLPVPPAKLLLYAQALQTSFVKSTHFATLRAAIQNAGSEPLLQLLTDLHDILTAHHADVRAEEEEAAAAEAAAGKGKRTKGKGGKGGKGKAAVLGPFVDQLAALAKLRASFAAGADEAEEEEAHESTTASTAATASTTVPPPRQRRKLSAAQRRRVALESHIPAHVHALRRLREDTAAWVQQFVFTFLPHVKSVVMHEVFFFDKTSALKRAFTAQPRRIMHTALARPHRVLKCASSLREWEDASVLYRLFLESGRLINLYDLLQSFTLLRAGGGESEVQMQARFTRAVHDLQYLGYMKPSKRKADHVMKLIF